MEMNALDRKALVAELGKIVSDRYVSPSPFEGMKNATTPLGLHVEETTLPYAVAMPANSQEISRILKLANRERVPVFIRGAGTSLIGQSRPHRSGIIINTHRMKRLTIHQEYGYFECEAGITAAKVGDALGRVGCFLPV